MPVQGKVIRYFNEADAAGIKRPGIVVATSDNACPYPNRATIRYRGPLGLRFGLNFRTSTRHPLHFGRAEYRLRRYW